jgi:hypothetical protein
VNASDDVALRNRIKEFNERHPAGTKIVVERVRGDHGSEVVRTVSSYGAEVLNGHSPVVYVTDGGGCWHLDHVVRVATDDDLAAVPKPTAKLWCVNILGPDDVVAAGSYIEALTVSHLLNDRLLRLARKNWTENDPRLWAAPAPWPHSAEGHAKSLASPGDDFSGMFDMARAMLAQNLGATGNFPDGKVHQDDAGELTFAVGALNTEVAVQFGSPVQWFSLPPATARVMARALFEKADALDGLSPVGMTLNPTEQTVAVDHGNGPVPTRLWAGQTHDGVPIHAMIAAVAPQTHDEAVAARYQATLKALKTAPKVIDLRFVN